MKKNKRLELMGTYNTREESVIMRVQHSKLGKGTVIKQFEYKGMELAHVEFESGKHVIPMNHLEELTSDTLQEFLKKGEHASARTLETMNELGLLPDDLESVIMLASALTLFTSELADELDLDD